MCIYFACEQSLHLGISWKVDGRETRGRRRESRMGWGEGVGGEKGELATMSHKFSFPPRKLRSTVFRDQRTKLLIAITNQFLSVCPFRNWRTAFSWTWFSYVLLQLFPTLFIVLLNGLKTVHVSELFYPVEFNRAKKPTLEGSAWTGRLNLSSLFRPKQGAWHKRIQLMKCFDFLSTRTTNSVRLVVGSQYSIFAIQHFHTYSLQMRESHQTSPGASISNDFLSQPFPE